MDEPGPRMSVAWSGSGERRAAERFAAVMPLTVEGHAGTTQDLSTAGLSFHSARPYEPGTPIEVVIEYLLDGHRYPLRCRAEVVRSEAAGDGWHVGARLRPQSRIAPASPAGHPGAGRRHLRTVP